MIIMLPEQRGRSETCSGSSSCLFKNKIKLASSSLRGCASHKSSQVTKCPFKVMAASPPPPPNSGDRQEIISGMGSLKCALILKNSHQSRIFLSSAIFMICSANHSTRSVPQHSFTHRFGACVFVTAGRWSVNRVLHPQICVTGGPAGLQCVLRTSALLGEELSHPFTPGSNSSAPHLPLSVKKKKHISRVSLL